MNFSFQTKSHGKVTAKDVAAIMAWSEAEFSGAPKFELENGSKLSPSDCKKFMEEAKVLFSYLKRRTVPN